MRHGTRDPETGRFISVQPLLPGMVRVNRPRHRYRAREQVEVQGEMNATARVVHRVRVGDCADLRYLVRLEQKYGILYSEKTVVKVWRRVFPEAELRPVRSLHDLICESGEPWEPVDGNAWGWTDIGWSELPNLPCRPCYGVVGPYAADWRNRRL